MNQSNGQERSVTVLGAGIVGISTALYLQMDGRPVTLIDRDGPGEGTSSGNAGIIATGAVIPIGTPGVIKNAPKMLLDPLAPLSVRWSYLPWIAPWLLRMLRASTVATISNLEDRIAAIDYQLDHPAFRMSQAEKQMYWRERVRLMDSLVKLRYAQAQRASF